MAIWFTSDTHYGHRNIIDYCQRPFGSVHHMNQAMISNWNQVVQPDDLVYFLGDFGMGPKSVLQHICSQLQGHKVCIRGNHDKSAKAMLEIGFQEVFDNLEIDLDEYRIYMAHIPISVRDPHVDDRKYNKELTVKPPLYYDYFLCGHVHEKWVRRGKVINVGVDQWGYTPVNLQTLMGALDSNTYLD